MTSSVLVFILAVGLSLSLSLQSYVYGSSSVEEETTSSTTSDESCSIGLDILKGIIDEGNAPQSTIDMYNDGLREDELKAYMDENIDDLAIPEWMKDSNDALCLVANSIAEQEKLQGSRLTEGSELDDAISLQALNTQGELAADIMSAE